MTKRDYMLSALHHEEALIPSWSMAFENIETAQRLLGEENTPTDIHPLKTYRLGAADPDNQQRKLRYAEKVDDFVIGVGQGGSFSFGHRGPGEFMERLLEQDDKHILSVYETGVKREVRFSPHFYRHYDYPAETLEAFREMVFPDVDMPGRFDGIKEESDFFHEKGYFTYGCVNGFFSGLHYFLCPYDELLVQLLLDEDFVDEMLEKVGRFNLRAAEHLLRAGVDCITFCDDLGSGNSLLFSPELYDRFFFKWHRELADLCHSYGAYLHMHSHGNINKVVGRIVEAGVDLLNPCDPYESMDMRQLKEAYGDKITFVGGVDKFVFDWDRETLERNLRQLFTVGHKGGGYVFMETAGGIPENISKPAYEAYRELTKQLRYEISGR